jgi:hypothetical protein
VIQPSREWVVAKNKNSRARRWAIYECGGVGDALLTMDSKLLSKLRSTTASTDDGSRVGLAWNN